jgi:hypothetical protein
MDIPILGEAGGANAPGLTVNCEVHDSEIMEIERVLEIMNDKAQSRVDFDAWDREFKDRMLGIGFVVGITWWHTNVEGVKRPDITISDRTERKPFDYDRQVHEVTHDILDLGEGGVIKSNPEAFKDQEHGH